MTHKRKGAPRGRQFFYLMNSFISKMQKYIKTKLQIETKIHSIFFKKI